MKRKADPRAEVKQPLKKRSKTSLSEDEARKRFRNGLLDKKVLEDYTSQYARSEPYQHAVIHELIDDKLLRDVREEIRNNVSFTPKETDIYKIHQSGDLANLDGLDDEALAKLPSLLALRDAMYSQSFRDYVAHITGCGPLSGRKTDMAINVYTPGSFLLCHDDVIGSRKVSYILYLTDPDIPWQAEWGGALRLFPVNEHKNKDGEVAKTPAPDFTKVIPPAWNQLSFFAVQPGESFHDVEEVYHADSQKQLESQGGRVRMAISGWFHIPQLGEDGYVKGAEEKQAKNSSLMQLKGNPDQYDLPHPQVVPVKKSESDSSDEFDESDLEFLLKYMAPTYLTPDTLEQISDHFNEQFSITLPDLLNKKYAKTLREYVSAKDSAPLPEDAAGIEKGPWRVARPPHKHRYLYLQPHAAAKNDKSTSQESKEDSPIKELLEVFLPSPQFRRWLQMATGSVIESHDLLARRFRHGKDYTLATGHDGKARLELNLGLTPTLGWGDEEGPPESEAEAEQASANSQGSKSAGKSKKGKAAAEPPERKKEQEQQEPEEVGGTEVYMAGDDGDGNDDAAIYKSGGAEDDDNILFFQAATWNTLTIVLRDSGTLKFVKYVSRKAKGDRWDISGIFEVEERDEDEDDDDANGIGNSGSTLLEQDTEEEWNGFPSSSEDSDSD